MAACGLLILLVSLWAGSVFKVKTKDGILILNVSEPNAEVYVDGEKISVTWGKAGRKAEIRVKPGTRKVQVKKEGFSAFGEEVTLEDAGRHIITAKLDSQPRLDVPPSSAPQSATHRRLWKFVAQHGKGYFS